MAKRKKLTANQQAYRKQIRRLRNIELKLLKQGAVLETLHSLKIPTRVTNKMINDLKEIKPRNIRAHAEIEFNGDFIPYNQYARIVKKTNQINKRIPNEEVLAQQIIANVKSSISTFEPKFASWLDDYINKLITSFGPVNFARTVQAMPMQFSDYLNAYLPDYRRAVSEFSSDLYYYFGNEDIKPLYDYEEFEDWEDY